MEFVTLKNIIKLYSRQTLGTELRCLDRETSTERQHKWIHSLILRFHRMKFTDKVITCQFSFMVVIVYVNI